MSLTVSSGEPPKPGIRVLHITFNMGIGGTEQVIKQLVLGMADKGVTSEILCIDGHIGAIGQALQESGVAIHQQKRKQGFDWSLPGAIRKQLRAGRFDVVHCHQYTPWIYGWLGAIGTKASVVFTEHGRFHPDTHRRKARLINPVLAYLTPAIVAISEATKKALVEYEYIPATKIQVIYNGIAPLAKDEMAAKAIREKLGIPANAFVVGTVSRLDPVKNQPMMLKAFRLFLNKYPNAFMLMVGDGPDKDKLISLAQKLDISNNTIFTGFIKAPVHHFGAMDLFLLSSHTEGTSMTLLEAMSLKLPAVITDVGGNPEIAVQNITGKLTEPDNAESFANAMVEVASSSKIKNELGEKARQRFCEKFSVEAMIDHYLSIYVHN